jgi:hypothetical protein
MLQYFAAMTDNVPVPATIAKTPRVHAVTWMASSQCMSQSLPLHCCTRSRMQRRSTTIRLKRCSMPTIAKQGTLKPAQRVDGTMWMDKKSPTVRHGPHSAASQSCSLRGFHNRFANGRTSINLFINGTVRTVTL